MVQLAEGSDREASRGHALVGFAGASEDRGVYFSAEERGRHRGDDGAEEGALRMVARWKEEVVLQPVLRVREAGRSRVRRLRGEVERLVDGAPELEAAKLRHVVVGGLLAPGVVAFELVDSCLGQLRHESDEMGVLTATAEDAAGGGPSVGSSAVRTARRMAS